MIDFKQFVEKPLLENSLYTTQAEKDALIKNKQRLYDAFYLNFFAFLGMFSINQLAPLKKYEQTEGKLIVDNIGDKNHDVSLAIKLLYDEKLITRTVVDNMTKLLAKIKLKQIKPNELDENIVRKMLSDMQYTSHRGTPQVMRVVDDFADGRLQLKHVAFQLYTLAKKKEYKDITNELRGIGVYYSGWFKKVGADTTPTSVVSQPVAAIAASTPVAPSTVTAPDDASSAVAPVAKSGRKPKDVTPVQPPAPKGKVPEFWHALWNARGKVEFSKVFKEYGVADGFPMAEFTMNLPSAMLVGNINVDDLKKSYPYMTSKNLNFLEGLQPLFLKWIEEADSISTLASNILDIKDEFSKDRIIFVFTRSPLLSVQKKDKILSLFKNLLDSVTTPNFSFQPSEIKPIAANIFANSFRRIDVEKELTFEQAVKAYSLFGPTVTNPQRLKDRISAMLNGAKLDPWSTSYIQKSDYDKYVDRNTQRIINMFGILDKLAIVISDAGDFDGRLKLVMNDATFNEFYSKVIKPIIANDPENKLDAEKSKKLVDQVINFATNYQNPESTFDYVKNVVRMRDAIPAGRQFWTATFWDKIYFKAISDFEDNKITMSDFAGKLRMVDRYSSYPQNHKAIVSKLEQRFIDYFASTILQEKSTDYYIGNMIASVASEYFLDKVLQKVTSKYSTFYYRTFSDIPARQVITRETSEKVFEALVENDWKFLKIDQFVNLLTNKEEFGKWLAEFISTKSPTMPNVKSTMIRWMTKKFDEFEPNDEQLQSAFDLDYIVGDLYSLKNNNKIMEHFGKKFLEEAEKDEPSLNMQNIITKIVRTDEGILKSLITDETTDSQISGLLIKTMGLLDAGTKTSYSKKSWSYIRKETYGFDLKCATLMFQAMGSRVFGVPGGEQAVERVAEILTLPSKIQKEYRESVITEISTLFTNAEVNADTERAFSKFEKKTQKMLAANFAMAQFAGGAVDEINNNAIIKPRSVLPAKGALKVLKLNQVSIPSASVLDLRGKRGQDITLQAVKDAAVTAAKTFKLEEQAIKPIQQSEEELEKISVVYNRYNRYRHGGIAIKIRKVFDVNVQSQQIGWKEFLEEAKEAIANGTYYHKFPQFHGTASLPASMILRYGFSVIDEKLAREAGIKYAGRMLGDGIYSSNVLDKVSQYINDDAPTGVSRRRGVVGYIFEMDTHGTSWGRTCNVTGADFATGGTGEFRNERGGLVSPEWAWKYANKQCKIKRCFEIELINKDEMDELVAKHKDVMEALGFSSFKEYLLSEAKATKLNTVKNYASFTFMDNIVPVGNGKFVDLNEEPESNLRLPAGAVVDYGMYGVTIMFKHTESINTRLLYGSDIQSNYGVRSLYEKLLGKKV